MLQLTREQTGLSLTAQRPIKRNADCEIWRARSEGEDVIVKRYHGDDPTRMRLEADGLRLYARTYLPGMLSSGVSQQLDVHNTLCIHPVEGEPLGRLIYRGVWRPGARRRALGALGMIGRWLGRVRRETCRPGLALDDFAYEYMRHVSAELAALGLGERFVAAPAEARVMSAALRASAIRPSFAHGDLVPLNVHVSENGVGVIDFANCLSASHPLNDVYGLAVALWSMSLPRSYTDALIRSLLDGLGPLDAPICAHEFYFEFHRRRWLMLQLRTRSPLRRAKAWLAQRGWGRPFQAARALR